MAYKKKKTSTKAKKAEIEEVVVAEETTTKEEVLTEENILSVEEVVEKKEIQKEDKDEKTEIKEGDKVIVSGRLFGSENLECPLKSVKNYETEIIQINKKSYLIDLGYISKDSVKQNRVGFNIDEI